MTLNELLMPLLIYATPSVFAGLLQMAAKQPETFPGPPRMPTAAWAVLRLRPRQRLRQPKIGTDLLVKSVHLIVLQSAELVGGFGCGLRIARPDSTAS